MRKISLILSLVCLLVLTGCRSSGTDLQNSTSDNTSEASVSGNPTYTKSEMFTDRDFEIGYDEVAGIMVTLQGNTAECASDLVKIDGSVITVTGEGTYVFSGNLTDGAIVVNADSTAKPHLVFNGISVTNSSSAAFYIVQAEKVFVTLESNTQNTLANGGEFSSDQENNVDGTVFSKDDLTFNGSGNLTVTSPAGHGIVCKDDLVFTGGNFVVQAASHGLDANDSVRITNTTLTLDAGKDGIHAENEDDTSLGFVYIADGSITANAQGDGISAASDLTIAKGTLAITAGGGSQNATKKQSDFYGGFMGGHSQNFTQSTDTEDSGTSMKGLKAGGDLHIADGSFTLNTADDSLHTNGSMTVTGGTFAISSGDDGLHADETLTLTGGDIVIDQCYEGLEALNITLSGGNVTVTAEDDGLNAAGGTDQSGFGGPRGGDGFGRGGSSTSGGSITITDGTLQISASGDGIDSNGTLEISGGHVTVSGPTVGDTAVLDYDATGTITGGTFIGTGAYQMAQTFNDSQQGIIAVTVGNQAAGTTITVKDGETVLLSYEPPLDYAIIIISSPQLEKGQRYTLTVGSVSETIEVS